MKNFIITLIILLSSMTSIAQSLNFDGVNDYATIPSTGTGILGDFSVPHDYTIEILFKFTGTSVSKDIFGRRGTTSNFHIATDHNGYMVSAIGASNSWIQETPSIAIQPNIWYHFAMSVNKNNWITRVYIDGVEYTLYTQALFDAYGYPNGWPQLGYHYTHDSNINTTFAYSGTTGVNSSITIDYVRVWDDLRTPTEISNNMLIEVNCNEANLMACFKFNDGIPDGNNSGITTLSDCTGNGYDATLSNLALNGTSSNFIGETTVLPVELTAFEGFAQKNNILLNWSTASEENNKGFYIERSPNGKNWEVIDFVAGNGTTYEAKYYQYEDDAPYNGENYYRLKQIDFNDQFEYSDIINIKKTHQNTNITLFPNPVVDRLLINSESEIETVTVFNMIGQPILQQLAINSQQLELSVSDLSKGIYTLQIKERDSNEVIIKQFIK